MIFKKRRARPVQTVYRPAEPDSRAPQATFAAVFLEDLKLSPVSLSPVVSIFDFGAKPPWQVTCKPVMAAERGIISCIINLIFNICIS